ncbi:MAG: hypothetical protein ACXVEF_34770 [Polyangiales bacterium]
MRRALIVFFLALGCGSSSGDAAPVAADEDVGAVDDTAVTAPEDTAPSYPAGPYGKTVGSVLADMSLLGYLRDDTTGLATMAT